MLSQGDVLATLENEDYVAAIAKAKADIEYAKADLAEAQRQERLQEGLFRDKVVSQDALDAAKAKVALAAATIEQDKASLAGPAGQLRLHHDSRALRRRRGEEDDRGGRERGADSSRGEHLDSSGAIVAIADMNSLEAEVDVNEANVAQLQSGQPAEITGAGHSRPHL